MSQKYREETEVNAKTFAKNLTKFYTKSAYVIIALHFSLLLVPKKVLTMRDKK